MILCVCARFCGPESSLPPVFHPGSAKSMAAELDKIRNGPNCACSAKVDQFGNIIENNRKSILGFNKGRLSVPHCFTGTAPKIVRYK